MSEFQVSMAVVVGLFVVFAIVLRVVNGPAPKRRNREREDGTAVPRER